MFTGKRTNCTATGSVTLCLLTDIVIFARPNKRIKGEDTHHVKRVVKVLDLKVEDSSYACTQPGGEAGLDLRVEGTPNLLAGDSPYQAYAIW